MLILNSFFLYNEFGIFEKIIPLFPRAKRPFTDISLNHKTTCDKTTRCYYYLQFPDGKVRDRKSLVTLLGVPR